MHTILPRTISSFCLSTVKTLLFCLLVNGASAQSASTQAKPRIIITADPELDDNNSLIRLIVYSSDLEIEGLIYTSSQFHWKGDGKGTKWFVPGREYDRFGMNECPCESWRWADDERFIDDIVDAYEEVHPNLKKHDADYPSPDALRSKIRYGNIEFDGDISKDSPGSDLIKATILDDKPGQLFITAWGGHSSIARALKSIQEQYEFTKDWNDLKDKISRKVVLLPSGDQDDTYGSYIKPNWPDIEYRQFKGAPNFGYGAQIRASQENTFYLTPAWMKENVTDKGPLGALYRVWGDGKQMVEGDKVDYFGLSGHTDEELKKMGYFVWMPVQAKGSWLGEGDNHTFMNMLGNGLRAYEKGYYGGWGGRVVGAPTVDVFAASTSSSAEEMAARLGATNSDTEITQREYPDFFVQAQADFANRLHWSVTANRADANHEPVVQIEGPQVILASPGQKIKLNGHVSDPDGDEFSVKWWQMPVGTYTADIEIVNPDSLRSEITIPKDVTPSQTIHLILEAKDQGTPALTRYQRLIIVIREK